MVRLTSPPSPEYNCIAWAAGEDDRWWWPVGGYYWPVGAATTETIDAFVEAYATLGFALCEGTELEPFWEKIALYVDSRGTPTHAARQLEDGQWASKLGSDVDVEHETPDEVTTLPGCQIYGRTEVFMRRPRL